MDAGAWLDEAREGYWDLGDHLRSVRSLAVSGDGRYIATVSDHEHRCVVHLVGVDYVVQDVSTLSLA